MFSPVSQISNPYSPFFSLSLPFISSLTPFHHFGVFNPIILFQLNLGLSMDSTTFVISLLFLSLPQSPHLQYLPSSFLPPSTLVLTLSPPFHLMCLMVYPLSLNSLHFFSFPLFHFTLFHPSLSLHIFIPPVFTPFPLPSLLVSLPSNTSIPFPFHCHPLFLHPFHIQSQRQPSDHTSFWYLL